MNAETTTRTGRTVSVRTISLLVSLLLVAGMARGEEKTSLDASKPAPEATATTAPTATAKTLQIEVISVTGIAEKRLVEGDGKWAPIKAGEKLSDLTIIRTGMRSKVVLKFADYGEMTVKSATKMGLREFRKREGKVRNYLSLKYGSMRMSVDSSRGEVDARVSTPVATLSVRGSEAVIAYAADRGLGLRGKKGTWRVAVGPRTRDVTPGESTNTELLPAVALKLIGLYTEMGDAFGGLTRAEKKNSILNSNPRSLSNTN